MKYCDSLADTGSTRAVFKSYSDIPTPEKIRPLNVKKPLPDNRMKFQQEVTRDNKQQPY